MGFEKGHIPWHKGKTLSEDHKRRISEALKGRVFSEKHRQRMSEAEKGMHIGPATEFKKGHTPWIKGKRHTEKSRRKMSEAHKGKRLSEETRRKMSESREGEKNWNWKGGELPDYRGPDWRRQQRLVRVRDRGICWNCGAKEDGKKHDIHHIVPFRTYGLERHKEANHLDNLMTLCHICHLRLEAITTEEEILCPSH